MAEAINDGNRYEVINGVLYYVIVNPRTHTLRHYRIEVPGHYARLVVYSENESVTFDCLPTIVLTAGNLFAAAPDIRF